jgi:phage FluMu protein gp41
MAHENQQPRRLVILELRASVLCSEVFSLGSLRRRQIAVVGLEVIVIVRFVG